MSNVNINGLNITVLDGGDAVNVGLSCCKCGGSTGLNRVVYHISKPMGTFQAGSYCYPCLLTTCRVMRGFPYPMERDLLDKLQFDLTGGGKKIMIMRGGIND